MQISPPQLLEQFVSGILCAIELVKLGGSRCIFRTVNTCPKSLVLERPKFTPY